MPRARKSRSGAASDRKVDWPELKAALCLLQGRDGLASLNPSYSALRLDVLEPLPLQFHQPHHARRNHHRFLYDRDGPAFGLLHGALGVIASREGDVQD